MKKNETPATPEPVVASSKLLEIRLLVDKQACDHGLWFYAKTCPEAYLQQELRQLHGLIEKHIPSHSNPSKQTGGNL